ncbi:MAG: HlyD family type I secretion periplasmic adaptor subunit [Desulfobacula sp.]|jgi:HlyD family type I secretion membrane fusion protein|nr:HlyD family type I secretion periplasmic adaptor subunit [Desulfobacula sp.]
MSFNKIEKFRTKPNKLIVAGLLVIGFFFGGLGGISATMPFSGAVIAEGVVKISNERKTLQHLEGGIVDKILIKEGDTVKKGDVLIRLKSSQIDSSVEMIRGMLLTKLVQFDRLSAEKDMVDVLTWSDQIKAQKQDLEVDTLMKKEQDIFISRRDSLRSRISMHGARIRQLNEKIIGVQDELKARDAIISSLKEEIGIKEPLLKENYLDRSDLLALNRNLEENNAMMARNKQAIAESREQIEEIRLSSIDLENNYRERAVSEFAKTNEDIFELEEKLKPRVDARERLDIVAPVSGEVINLRIHSEQGGILRAGEAILDIVPAGARLLIECKLRQDKITAVKEGQKARIQLSAFNRITTPPLEAEITYVSPDTMMEKTQYGEMSFYLIHAVPLEGELKKHNAWLAAGMPAACFIETERRTFLQYLIEPILLNIDRSLRESL